MVSWERVLDVIYANVVKSKTKLSFDSDTNTNTIHVGATEGNVKT